MKTGRRFQAAQMPSLNNVGEFGTSCLAWWRAIQPLWRGDELLREIPVDADWSVLLCGGSTGMLLVVLALSWWMSACDAKGLVDERLDGLITEVSWTLVEMQKHLVGKRRHDGEEGEVGQPARKK